MKNPSQIFVPGIVAPQPLPDSAEWFIFHEHRLLIDTRDPAAAIPRAQQVEGLPVQITRHQFLGFRGETPCFAALAADDSTGVETMRFSSLRSAFTMIDEPRFSTAGRALQIIEWDRTHQFCGRCGSPLKMSTTERAKTCENCKLAAWPRISPAVIVAVTRGDRILLARANRFPEGMFSVLAGFVEPGESLEETVGREICEEVGIQVKNIRYFGSQPWPFPHSLMIGFTAEYDAGNIVVDQDELVEADWFGKDNLPMIPPRISIARKLIDWFRYTRHSP